jgi:hypothetical protein
MSGTYHAPHFEPTVDEIETLKQLEMGERPTPIHTHNGHLPERLLERGFIAQRPDGSLAITDAGRQVIRRQNN